MNRTEMIKWLSENTTREQWEDRGTLFFIGERVSNSVKASWRTNNANFGDTGSVVVMRYTTEPDPQTIRIDDVFEPEFMIVDYGVYSIGLDNGEHEDYTYNPAVKKFEKYPNGPHLTYSFVHPSNKRITHFEPVIEQPVYIDGAVYEIGLMDMKPEQFTYNIRINMFERGTNQSISASSVQSSSVVTHFKLISEPERITDREAIDAIRREEAAEFMDSSAVMSEPQGLFNHDKSVEIGELTGTINGLKHLVDLPLSAGNVELFNTIESLVVKPSDFWAVPDEPTYSAVSMLNEAAECIGDRAAERDTDSERSMLATVNAFNAMYGTELTETQGWMFMVFLKASRAKGGDFREDDYVDGASYFALAGECDGNVRR